MCSRKLRLFRPPPHYKERPDGTRRWLEYDEPEWDWWDWAAADRSDFRSAVETLVEANCDVEVLRRLLDLIHNQQDRSSSRQELRRVRRALDEGRNALLGLLRDEDVPPEELLSYGPLITPREERLRLDYSSDDTNTAVGVLADLSQQLKKLEHKADRRRTPTRDQYRAMLVRYIKQQTGRFHDGLVCDLLNAAMAPEPEMHIIHVYPDEDPHGDVPDERWLGATVVEREAPDIWDDLVTVESHRVWRTRNNHLIDKPPKLEAQWQQDLKRKTEEQTEPKAQWLLPPRLNLSGKKRQNPPDKPVTDL